MEIIFLRAAEDDLFNAWASYEEILPGLGDRFEKEIRTALDRIQVFPESAPVYKGEFRRFVGTEVSTRNILPHPRSTRRADCRA